MRSAIPVSYERDPAQHAVLTFSPFLLLARIYTLPFPVLIPGYLCFIGSASRSMAPEFLFQSLVYGAEISICLPGR